MLAAVVAARGLVGAGALSGGALLPAPPSALDWWREHLAAGHDLGAPSTAPAAPYLLPLALLGTVLGLQAGLAVDLLMLAAVPLAAWGALRFLRRLGGPGVVSLAGAAAYGVLPVVTGSVQGGRLGTVAGAVVLPWLAHAALFLARERTPDRRARAAWRATLWLAVLVAFVPLAWPVAALLAVLAAATRTTSRAVLVPVGVTLALLAPWSVATWSHQGPASWLFEAGLPVPGGGLTPWDVLTGRPGGGAPGWLSVLVPLAAVAALVPRATRPAVQRCWVVLVVALGTVALLSGVSASTANAPQDRPLWLGFPLVLAQGAAISAVVLAAGARGLEPRRAVARPGVAALLLLALAATPLLSVGWWVATGSGGPLDRGRPADLPTYLAEAVATDAADGVLVVRGTAADGFTYLLLRRDGLRTGDEAVLPTPAEQAPLTARVTDLVTAPGPEDVRALARAGVAYLYAPAPADPELVADLDSLRGVSPGSAPPGARAWLLEAGKRRTVPAVPGDARRPWLLALQGLAVVAVPVLAAPSRGGRR